MLPSGAKPKHRAAMPSQRFMPWFGRALTRSTSISEVPPRRPNSNQQQQPTALAVILKRVLGTALLGPADLPWMGP